MSVEKELQFPDFQFQCKSRQQLAREYGISRRTLFTWFVNENLDFHGKLLKPIDLQIIYNTFGHPRMIETD